MSKLANRGHDCFVLPAQIIEDIMSRLEQAIIKTNKGGVDGERIEGDDRNEK